MKVLLIEDDPANVELMRLRLEALDCRVLDARTPADGLRLAAATRPELVLLDMQLNFEPLAGIEVLRALRADPATADIPVIVHSIYVNDPTDLPAELPKADGLLPKPFKFQELKALIDRFRPPIALHPAGHGPDGEPLEGHRKGAWWPEAL